MLALSFTGCGNKREAVEHNPEQLKQYAEILIGSFSQMDDVAFEQIKDGSDLQVNLMLMKSGLPVEKKEFISMMDSWKAAIDECGAYIEHGEYKVEANNKGVTLTTEAAYQERNATIEIRFDEKLNMESMDISAKYTKGEILKKAGLNTVLGMGTVFTVLIFLAFIISLLKYVPKLVDKFNKKKNADIQSTGMNSTAAAQESTQTVTDDLELVAVIAAAIAAHTGTSTDDFVVRSIKRRTSKKWN